MNQTFYSIQTTNKKNIIFIRNSNPTTKTTYKKEDEKKARELSLIGSESYKRAQRRAFQRAKQISFFNPQLDQFITLTYRDQNPTTDQVYEDIKYMLKQHKRQTGQSLQYVYVLEYQKRGTIHVHMIASKGLQCHQNINNYPSINLWPHGYSSVLTIADTDNEFKPYLYLFKYMAKSQRIGRSFIHTSRNFDKIKTMDYADFESMLITEDIIHSESYAFTVNEKKHRITKDYYRTQEA